MRLSRSLLLSGMFTLILLSMIACASNTTGNSASTPTNHTTFGTTSTSTISSPTTTPSTPTPTPTVAVIAHLHFEDVMIAGKSESIVVNAQRRPLYYFTSDTKTTSACTGSCSHTWPAVLGEAALPGPAPVVFDNLPTPNGVQLQYEGHFLYTYVGDTAPGQINGQGIAGKWFVATLPLSPLS